MEYRILGPLEVWQDGRALPVPRAKQRALLLALLLRPNETVSVDVLIEALWGGEPPPTALIALQGHVSQLRKLLPEETLLTRPQAYLLRVAPHELDLDRFEQLRTEARSAQDFARAAEALREALDLWRGPPLFDFAENSVLRAEAARLEELRATAVEERVGAELELGLHAELVAELEGLVRTHPFRERLRAQLMLALYRSGRQADALEAYQSGRTLLLEELGIDPGPALQRLHQQILRQDGALLAPTAEPERDLLVGRSPEVLKLLGLVEAAVAARGQTVLIAGEAGIGKTRLAEEAVAFASTRGVRAAWARSYEDEASPPYWLWEQILRGLGLAESNVLAAEGEQDRFRRFDELASLLRAAAEQQPLLIVLDDLHWADPASLLALQFVARTSRQSRLLVVGTYRTTDVDEGHPFMPVLRQLRREHLCEDMQLRGLAVPDVGELVRAANADESLAVTLHGQTGGNPFFVREILRNLPEAGAIEIPQTIREVVTQRLARLSAQCNELVTAAAILGTFSDPEAARMLGVERARLVTSVDEAVDAGVLVQVDFGRYAFSHALLRETLEARLDSVARVELHRRAGEALETVHADDLEPHLGELARHFADAARGGEARKAIEYCRSAAAQATRELAYEQSAQQIGRALQLLELEENVSRRERCDLLLDLGEAYWRSGEFNKAQRTFRDAAELARALGDWSALARSASGYAGGAAFAVTRPNTFLVELLEDAIAAVPEGESLYRARLQARLAEALIAYPERADDAARLVDGALLLSKDDPATSASVITSAFLVRWTPNRLAMATELVELGTRLRSDSHRLNGLTWRIQAYAELGDVDGIDGDLRDWEQTFERSPFPYFRWGLQLQRGMRALLRGDFAEGLQGAQLAREVGEANDNPNAARAFALQLVGIAREEGVTGELLQMTEATIEQYPTVAAWRAVLSTLYARASREDDARRELARIGQDGFDAIPRDFLWTVALSYSAESAALLGDVEAAAVLYSLLEPLAHLHVVVGSALWDGSIARRLALLALVLGRDAEAASYYTAALDAEGRMGARAAVAHTEGDYELVARRRGSR